MARATASRIARQGDGPQNPSRISHLIDQEKDQSRIHTVAGLVIKALMERDQPIIDIIGILGVWLQKQVRHQPLPDERASAAATIAPFPARQRAAI